MQKEKIATRDFGINVNRECVAVANEVLAPDLLDL